MANDFSTDFRCVALWRVEDGALTADSKGSNTLSDPNTCSADTTNYKEGSASLQCAVTGSKYLTIADASLSATFPWKNGDTSTRGTICFWVRPTNATNSRSIISKWGAAAAQQFNVYLYSNKFRVAWGYSTSSVYTLDTASFVINQWYHIAIKIDMTGKTLRVRVWDDTAQAVYGYSYSPATVMKSGTGPICIGYDNSANYFDGQVDEVVVFNDFLDISEIDRIRAGTFTGFIYSVPSAGLNDFSADSTCMGYWRMEPDALVYDSKGSTYLTNLNAMDGDTIVTSAAEPGFFKEGSGSARFSRDSRTTLSIQDIHLPAGFPTKSDDGTKTATICFWVKPFYAADSVARYLVAKYDWQSNKRQFAICLYANQVLVYWSSAGTAADTYSTGIYLTMHYWHHVTVVFDGVNKYLNVQVWREDTRLGSQYTNLAVTSTMYVGPAPFTIGSSGSTQYSVTEHFEGLIDEVVVFNRMLNGEEIELIRTGKYSGTGWTSSNNFSGTSNLVSQYRFESGALTADSKGTNTLTATGVPTNSTTALGCREGSNAVRLTRASSQCYSIADASLSAGFPTKSGDTTQQITICCWINPNSNPTSNTYHPIASKWDWNASKLSWNLSRKYSSASVSSLDLAAGYGTSGQTSQTLSHIITSAGHWYHITAVIDGVNQFMSLRVWDETAGRVVHTEAVLNNPLRIVDSHFCIGAERNSGTGFINFFDGVIDELLVFKKCLSPEDADRVRCGTFSGDVTYPISVSQVFAQVGVRYHLNRRVICVDPMAGDEFNSGFSWPEARRTLNTKAVASRDILQLAKSPEVVIPGTFTVTQGSFEFVSSAIQSLSQDNVLRVGDDAALYSVNSCAGLTIQLFRPYRGTSRAGVTVFKLTVVNTNTNEMNLLGTLRAFAGMTISVLGGVNKTTNMQDGFTLVGNDYVAIDLFENTYCHYWEYSRLAAYNGSANFAFDFSGENITMSDCYIFKYGYARIGSSSTFNFKANRCVCEHSTGLFSFSAEENYGAEIEDCEAFGGSWGLADGLIGSVVRRFKGGSFTSQALQLSAGGLHDIIFEDCNFDEGATTSNADIYVYTSGIVAENVVFRNCIHSPNLFRSIPSTYSWSGGLRFENFNRQDDQRIYYGLGVDGQNYTYLTTNDNDVYQTVPPSLKVAGSGTSTGSPAFLILPFTVSCISSSPVTINVGVRKNSAFGYLNPPKMRVRYHSGAVGSGSPGSIATVTEEVVMPDTDDTWVTLTKVVTSSITGVIEVEFVLLPDDPVSGLFWIDDFVVE